MDLSHLLKDLFTDMFDRHDLYRATGIVLAGLVRDTQTQYSLLKTLCGRKRCGNSNEAMDTLSEKYGKHTVHLGASHPIEACGKGKRGRRTWLRHKLAGGKIKKKDDPTSTRSSFEWIWIWN